MICLCVLYEATCRDDAQLWIQKRHGHVEKSRKDNSEAYWFHSALRFPYIRLHLSCFDSTMYIEEGPSVEGTKQQVVHHRSEGKFLRGEALQITFVFVYV